MYRVLIAEDEDIIRRGLAHIVERLELDLSEILEASNGMEALETARQEKPQIIITDIRMPEMNGLTFIEKIRETLPDTELIILSGYSEFEYARKAITLGVSEYLLKPIDKEKLRVSLTEAIRRLEQQEQRRAALEQERSSYLLEIKRLQKALLWKILSGRYSAELIKSELKNTHIQFENPEFLVLSAKCCRTAESGDSLSGLSGLEALLSQFPNVLWLDAEYGYRYFLLNPEKPQSSELVRLLEGLDRYTASLFHDKKELMQIGVSQWGQRHDLPLLIQQARYTLDLRLLSFGPNCFRYDSRRFCKAPHTQDALHGKSILDAFRDGGAERVSQAVKKYYKDLLNVADVTPEYLIADIKLVEKIIQPDDPSLEQKEPLEFLLSVSDTLSDFMDSITVRFLSLLGKRESYYSNSSVDYAIHYMETHYQKDLNLVYLSNLISMNTNYFSTLFKKKTGMSFVSYLQMVRIRRAQELLKDPAMKIYEVAADSGFQDEKYFFKIFKKVTGLTPNEFKNSLERPS